MIEKLIENYIETESVALQEWIDRKREQYPLDETIVIDRNIGYNPAAASDKNCKLDMFKKAGINENAPVLINLHGGGLLVGYKEQNDWLCAEFAKRGYVVLAVEYPKIPKVKMYELWDTVAMAFNYIEENIEKFGGNRNKVFWSGDSAGAYIATNLCVMKYNSDIRQAAKVREIKLECKALGLVSGMFYTTKKDRIGLTLPKMIFGEDYKTHSFYKFINPECQEFIDGLKPCFLATSEADMLKHHTISFYAYLKANHKNCQYVKFGKNPKLEHAFVALYPEYKESKLIINKMCDFFEKFV